MLKMYVNEDQSRPIHLDTFSSAIYENSYKVELRTMLSDTTKEVTDYLYLKQSPITHIKIIDEEDKVLLDTTQYTSIFSITKSYNSFVGEADKIQMSIVFI